MDGQTLAAVIVAGAGLLAIVGGFLTVIGAGFAHRTGVGYGIIAMIAGLGLFYGAQLLIPETLENPKSVVWANHLYVAESYVGWGALVIGVLLVVASFYAYSNNHKVSFWTGIKHEDDAGRQTLAIVVLAAASLAVLIYGIVQVSSDRKVRKVSSEFSSIVKLAEENKMITSEEPLGFKIRAKEDDADLGLWAPQVKEKFEAANKGVELSEIKVTAINVISLDRLNLTHVAVEFDCKKTTKVTSGTKTTDVTEDFGGRYITLKWTGTPDETQTFLGSWKDVFQGRKMLLKDKKPATAPVGPTSGMPTASGGLPLPPVAPKRP